MEKTSVPWAMRWPKGVAFMNSASMWCGKKSPVWPAWTTKSVSVMVRPEDLAGGADRVVLEVGGDFHQGCGSRGVAGAALEVKAASTSAMVVQASSTEETSSASSPAAKRWRFAHAADEGVGEPGALQGDVDPGVAAAGVDLEDVGLALGVVEVDAELQPGGAFGAADQELGGLMAAAELVVVVDRDVAADVLAIVEDGAGAGLGDGVAGVAEGAGMDALRVAEDLADEVEVVDRVERELDAGGALEEGPEVPGGGEREVDLEVDHARRASPWRWRP